MTIDQTSLTTDNAGSVTFSGLTVEQHAISIKNQDGVTSGGTMLMSSSSATQATKPDASGKFGLNVNRNTGRVYLTVEYNAGGIIGVPYAADTPPSPLEVSPEASAAATQTVAADGENTKKVTAFFFDEEGEAISGVAAQVTLEGMDAVTGVSSRQGSIAVGALPYGVSAWLVSRGSEESLFQVVMQKGVQTGLLGSAEENSVASYQISAKVAAAEVFLSFTQSENGFTLTEVSEKSPGAGGISTMALGIIIVAVAVAAVIIIVVVRKKSAQRAYYRARTNEEGQQIRQGGPRRTGGGNKFENRPKDNTRPPSDRSHM